MEIEAIVSGRVQLVMFRDYAQRSARALGLLGFVQNNKNGTVMLVAQGGKENLEKFVGRLKKGSFLSNVESVFVEWRTPREVFKDFEIHYYLPANTSRPADNKPSTIFTEGKIK